VNNNKDPLQKAKNYAFLLLKYRLRSEKEIYGRLKKKKFDEGIIEETIGYLKDKGFINDSLFAKTWIESRLSKPLGLNRIKQELKSKGIDAEIINEQFKAIKNNYVEEDIVLEIARERMKKFKEIDRYKAKRRVFAYLLRRGFTPEIVIDVINRL
jgi:regulatory protein